MFSALYYLDVTNYNSGSQKGFIGNRVFLDENGNGILDGNEGGIRGARVNLIGAGQDGLFGTSDDIHRSQIINNDGGYYGFDNLAAGQYKVAFNNLPADTAFTRQDVGLNDSIDSDVNPSTGKTGIISLFAGEFRTDIDAGLTRLGGPTDPHTGFIGNRVFLDENGNGILDGNESGVRGVRVNLMGAGQDGQFGTSDDINRSQVINNDGGFYGFKNLAAGQYQVSFDNLPAGTAFTAQDIGNDDHIDSDADPSTGKTDIINLSAGEFRADIDAGLVKQAPVDPGTARIGNRVFLDENGNGILDGNESGVQGVRVNLVGAGQDGQFGTSDDVNRSQVINNDGGFYGFTNLNAGQYQVSFDNLPVGTSFTRQDVGFNDEIDSDVNPNSGQTGVINLNPGEARNDIDAGILPAAPINNAPDARNDSRRTLVDTPVNINVLGNDVDPDGDRLSIKQIIGNAVNGTTQIVDGQVLYTPNDGFVGNDTFAYEISDGKGGHDVAQVTVAIEPAPNAAPNAADDRATTVGGVPVDIDTLGNDVDPDGDALSITSVNGRSIVPGQSVPTNNGSVELLDNGELSFTPDVKFGGTETFTYHVSDGNGGEDTATVNVDVAKANADLSISYNATQVGGPVGQRFGSDDIAFPFDVVRYDVTIKNNSGVEASNIVAKAIVPENLDIFEPGQTRSDTGLFFNQRINIAGFAWSSHFNGDPSPVDSTNGTVKITDPGTTPLGRLKNQGSVPSANTLVTQPSLFSQDGQKLANRAYGEAEGSVEWSLGESLAAGESATLSFYGMREVYAGYDFGVGNQFFTDAVIESFDQHDPNTSNNQATTRSWWVSPLALDLNGDGVQTLSIDAGVKFDILNSGEAVNTGWLSGQDGFLAVDANGNGSIDDRSELFGGNVGEGFAKLASFDSNGDGLVNGVDARFGELQLWQDANENGVTDQGELQSLASLGISDLKTGYTEVFLPDGQGNIHGEHSSATLNGNAIDMVDVYFRVG